MLTWAMPFLAWIAGVVLLRLAHSRWMSIVENGACVQTPADFDNVAKMGGIHE